MTYPVKKLVNELVASAACLQQVNTIINLQKSIYMSLFDGCLYRWKARNSPAEMWSC